jgi:murein DD-endopeptidase MepM/ murein hydrolase activator NlpD
MHRMILTLLLFVAGPLSPAWAGPIDVAQTAVQIARADAAITASGPLVDDSTLERLHRGLYLTRVQLESGDLLMVKLELALMGIEVVLDGDWEFVDGRQPASADPELQTVLEDASSLEFEANALLAMISRAESGGTRSDAAPRYFASGVQRRTLSEPTPLPISPPPGSPAPAGYELQPQPVVLGALNPVRVTSEPVVPVAVGSAAALAEPFTRLQGGGGSVATAPGERWLEPVHQPRITSEFGMRTHPVTGRQRMHRGVDYGAATGTPVRATASGRVLMAGWCGNGPGNCVVIEHVNGWRSQYFHLEEVHISAGADVAQGTEIGEIGSTGLSTGAHLHFQLGRDGQAVDPVPLLGTLIE